MSQDSMQKEKEDITEMAVLTEMSQDGSLCTLVNTQQSDITAADDLPCMQVDAVSDGLLNAEVKNTDEIPDHVCSTSKWESYCKNEIICLPYISAREGIEKTWGRWKGAFKNVIKVVCVILFVIYFAFALKHKIGDEGSVILIAGTALAVVILGWQRLRGRLSKVFKRALLPWKTFYSSYSFWIDMSFVIVVVGAVLCFLIVDVALRNPSRLISGIGVVVLISLMFLASHSPRKVQWRPVGWGLLLQFIFALLVLRTSWGKYLFTYLADLMTRYISFTDSGARFVFGEKFTDHLIAFQVMPIIVFFSATISLLYFLGVIQVIIKAIARVIETTMATGAIETLHAAINIFCGWGESLMIVRPFLEIVTLAELHAVMVNGFATVAGSTIAAYISFGAPALHLISASFMSAPAALAMSKLFYPNETNHKRVINVHAIPRPGTGMIDAASQGAVGAVAVIVHIMANLIAFVSLLAFINAALAWFGARIGMIPPDYPDLTFQLICSYLLWPLVFILGVPAQDCRIVASMFGTKTFISEFMAYLELGNVKHNREVFEQHIGANGTWEYGANELDIVLLGINKTLTGGVISARSEMLATYALCGFSDMVSLGIMMAALSAVAPSRRQCIMKVGPRALVAGIVSCLLTAAVAGLVSDH